MDVDDDYENVPARGAAKARGVWLPGRPVARSPAETFQPRQPSSGRAVVGPRAARSRRVAQALRRVTDASRVAETPALADEQGKGARCLCPPGQRVRQRGAQH